jgi:DNA-binding MarR family transcriptional regulator
MRRTRSAAPTGAAFLLAQLGAHAAQRFAKRIAPLGILPPHAGILHAIASGSIRNQRELARHLGVQPSRLVLLLDELSDKGLVERQRSASDRRNYELALTRKGEQLLEKMRDLVAGHEASLLAALTAEERGTLVSLLRKIADEQELTPGVHPGYRRL